MNPPHMSLSKEAGSLVFISGQLPLDSDFKIPDNSIYGQTSQVLKNIAAVLSANGLDASNIVKTTVWLRNEADFPQFNESYAAFFGDHKPARSTVISNLVLSQALVEIEAIAVRPT